MLRLLSGSVSCGYCRRILFFSYSSFFEVFSLDPGWTPSFAAHKMVLLVFTLSAVFAPFPPFLVRALFFEF